MTSSSSLNHEIHVRSGIMSLPERCENDTCSTGASMAAIQTYAGEMARSRYQEDFASSGILDKSHEFPNFSNSEILKRSLLGKGGFSIVYEINGFNISATNSKEISYQQQNETGEEDDFFFFDDLEDESPVKMNNDFLDESLLFIAKNCFRHGGDARYAIKQLKPDVIADQNLLFQGIYDMHVETRFLSSLPHHPNIIKLRGVAYDHAFTPDYFIVLDRLYDTLKQRIPKWKSRYESVKGLNGLTWPRTHNESKRDVIMRLHSDQLWAAFDLSSAVAHLHKHSIIHRDLKPDNIGFDVRGDIKIFDFGMAKEIPQDSTAGPWNLTGMCGTPRYMAPEVATGQPYDESCDVYSFSMLLWEIMAMDKPFGKITQSKLQSSVWEGNLRPKIMAKWSKPIRTLLEDSWQSDMTKRPNMAKVESILQHELIQGGGKEEGNRRFCHQSRRSTHIFTTTMSGCFSLASETQHSCVDCTLHEESVWYA